MNGGIGLIDSQIKIIGQDLTLSSAVPVRTDYMFIGWNTDKNSITAQYQPGDSYMDDMDIILLAIIDRQTTKRVHLHIT